MKVEKGALDTWQSDSVAPKDWTGFTALETLETVYDAMDRKVGELLSSGVTTHSFTQYSYDNLGRLECTAVRMNPGDYAALYTSLFTATPIDACLPRAEPLQNSFGPDRITKNAYDEAGQLVQVREAVGVSVEAVEATYKYTDNGKLQYLIDANGNRAEMRYDGHDRQVKWVFPSPAMPASYDATTQASALTTAGAVNEQDFEAYAYDASGNRISLTKRDGTTVIGSQYDALNRLTHTDYQGAPDLTAPDADVWYKYDLANRLVDATDAAGHFNRYGYDKAGRLTSETSLYGGAKTMLYDRNSRRTRLTHPSTGTEPAFHVGYSYYDTGEMKEIRENPTISNVLLASFAYDGLGRRTSLARGNGKVTSYDYAGTPFLASQTEFLGTLYEHKTEFAYNPASQIVTNTRSNDVFAWTGHGNGTTTTPVNGLNQLDVKINAAGTAQLAHDANGNMTNDGNKTFGYNARNLLTSAPNSVYSYIYYEPQGRLSFIFDPANGSNVMDYVGDEMISEGAGGGSITRRYVHGPNMDEPLVWYEGSGTGDPRYLHADERGSIIAVSDYAGTVMGVNTYDEYGMPKGSLGEGTLLGRFGYTGQAWIPELGLWYFKARMMNPELPRFMQTDPIGYKDGMNLYGYVGGDPMNFVDPTGECTHPSGFCETIENSTLSSEIIKPITTPVTLDTVAAIEKATGYSDQGRSEAGLAVTLPGWKVMAAVINSEQAKADAKYSGAEGEGWNDEKDAVRYVSWNIRMSASVGPATAKAIADAHERSGGNPLTERTMDLINNNNGRILQQIFPNMPARDLAKMAAAAGLLQTRPVSIGGGR